MISKEKLNKIVDELNVDADQNWEDWKVLELSNIIGNEQVSQFDLQVGRRSPTYYRISYTDNDVYEVIDTSAYNGNENERVRDIVDDFLFYGCNK